MSSSNPIQHLRDVQKLNTMIGSYEEKLQEKLNEAINHMMNYSHKINDFVLPEIPNKKIINSNKFVRSGQFFKRDVRTRSVGSKSFLQKSTNLSVMDSGQADALLDVYRHKTIKRQFKEIAEASDKSDKVYSRPIGSQKYGKPKFIKRNPQILSKQIRCNPFSEKNAIKANQLEKGMLHLVQSGKVGKNIDIITAFEKGRPVLENHQAIIHQAEQKYAFDQIDKGIQKQNRKKHEALKNIYEQPNFSNSMFKGQNQHFSVDQSSPNWAITMPEHANNYQQDHQIRKKNKNVLDDFEDSYYIKFLHFELIKNEQYTKVKAKQQYYENWGEIMNFCRSVRNILKEYCIDLAFVNSKKMLKFIIQQPSIRKIRLYQVQECLAHSTTNLSDSKLKITSNSLFSIENMANQANKRQKSAIKIQSTFRKFQVRGKYMKVLHRIRIQKNIQLWLKNGKLIKDYRKSLGDHFIHIKSKFQDQQKSFRLNYPTIQSSKHFEIHIPNRQFMKNFKYLEEISNTQITRIFNLDNSQTNLIYVCPWQISVQTINYYFKIMELEEIQSYHNRITFIELNSEENRISLPPNLSTSEKFYYNTKVLRKLKLKIGQIPSYFVINEPTQTDVRLSVFLGIPIYSGNFPKIQIPRSMLCSKEIIQLFYEEHIENKNKFHITPKTHTVLSFSNLLIRFCQSNKETNKFILKINNKHQSSGLALITYPFTSLPEMYSSTALVHSCYYKSIQKYYFQFIKKGGVIQKYQEGIKTVTVTGKILHDGTYNISGTFERVSSGFINIAYLFPQKLISHKTLMDKCRGIFQGLGKIGHFGNFEITLIIDSKQNITLQQIQLYATKITNSLSYFKFLAGGYFNSLGDFITKITGEEGEDEQIATMQSRGYCYIPFVLHFGLSDKQSSSFFQLCRIGGVSFDLENKFGSTFILLGEMKNCIGIITSAKDKKMSIRLMIKTLEFLIKQNSHNISNQMLQQKQVRMKERLNILALKERIESL